MREVLQYVGWQHVAWKRPVLRLKASMEIDFGGVGKEYAVDRALSLAESHTTVPVLVNCGGDLRVSGARHSLAIVGFIDLEQKLCSRVLKFPNGSGGKYIPAQSRVPGTD